MTQRPDGYRMAMAHVCRHFDAAPEDVFAVLTDPTTYPKWLLGAAKIRRIDANWPSPGSRFHHEVGVRPLVIPDSTEVIDIEPNRSLTLHVMARPFVSADVTFRIIGGEDGDGCVLGFQEEPSIRGIGNLVRPLMDPSTHLRNQRSLKSMDRVVQEVRQRRIRETAAAGTPSR